MQSPLNYKNTILPCIKYILSTEWFYEVITTIYDNAIAIATATAAAIENQSYQYEIGFNNRRHNNGQWILWSFYLSQLHYFYKWSHVEYTLNIYYFNDNHVNDSFAAVITLSSAKESPRRENCNEA